MKKLIDLPENENVILNLKIKAAKLNLSFKKYIETILIEDSKTI